MSKNSIPKPITTVEDLRIHLQYAIEVELATIPPYLTAYWSVIDQSSPEAKALIHVAIQEMLHLCLSSNTLTAVGGTVKLYAEDIVTDYPKYLPGHDKATDFYVPLANLSKKLLKDAFLPIEVPESPSAPAQTDSYDTIGQFYKGLEIAISSFPESIFTGDPNRQVLKIYDGGNKGGKHHGGNLFPIINKESALTAFNLIVSEGEGNPGDDGDDGDEIPTLDAIINAGIEHFSHYTIFKSLSSDTLSFDHKVYEIEENPSTKDLLSKHVSLGKLSQLFDASYCLLLRVLERFFLVGSSTEEFNNLSALLFGLMTVILPKTARLLLLYPSFKESSKRIGPSFEYSSKNQDEIKTASTELTKLPFFLSVNDQLKVIDNAIQALPHLKVE